MSDIDRMRKAIRDAYTSEAWWKKVDKMSDKQIFAIYVKFKSQKKLLKGE